MFWGSNILGLAGCRMVQSMFWKELDGSLSMHYKQPISHLTPSSEMQKNTSEKNIELRKNMRVAVVLVVLFREAFASWG